MSELADEYAYARDNGWISTFTQCGVDYVWPASVLMAIASRESNMRNIVGDGGHGHGCMQIDDRSSGDWCHSGGWQDPHACIEKGTQILEAKRTQIGRGIGRRLVVSGYAFTGKAFANQDELNKVAVACYNAGLWPYYSFSKGEPVDRFTTGHNYSDDVMARAAEFAKLLVEQTGLDTGENS